METMETQTASSLRNYWLGFLIRGIVALLFGIAAIVWPGLTLVFFVSLFGVFIVIDGIAGVVVALQERRTYPYWWAWLLGGIAGIILGIIVFFLPGKTSLLLFYLMAAWAIVTGIVEIIRAFSPRRSGQEWTLLLGGGISLLFGLILAAHPVASILALVWLIGAFAIVYGILLITRAFQFRSLFKA
jgi:uncharacterized membrane protein HdeD (DUF308 family)